jgi:cation transport regulator
MPYHTVSDLPESVRNALPEHAQHIYFKSFNSAWDEYADPDERHSGADREETAHKVAWSAVKQSYHKTAGGSWQKKG